MSIHWGEGCFHFYVDDLLFWAKYEAYITQVALILRYKGVDVEQEYGAAGFLGVKIECDAETGLIKMLQDGLIDSLIAQLVIDEGYFKVKCTPANAKPLVKD